MDTVEALLWLCTIASPTGHETRIADELGQYLSSLPARLAIRRYGDSLVVDLVSNRPGPKIALVGHTDVVPTIHDGPPRIEGDRLYGPGASDMKSGLALMLSLAKRPEPDCPNLSLIFYASEEGPYVDNELSLVFAEEPSLKDLDFALVLEPTDNQLQLGCGGTIHARFTFEGRSAHSARPWQGDNAIYKAIPVLERLKAYKPVPRVVDGLEWMKSMSGTMANGGRAPNVICDRFELNVNARFAPDQSQDEIERELLELAHGEATVTLVDCSPPAQPHRNHPFIRLLETTGGLAVAPKFGWTDVARLSTLGIPAANFGPGTLSQAHQRNEYTSIEALQRGESVLRRWLAALPVTEI
jgi:succinyl-diaminopimelate desuccinylase